MLRTMHFCLLLAAEPQSSIIAAKSSVASSIRKRNLNHQEIKLLRPSARRESPCASRWRQTG